MGYKKEVSDLLNRLTTSQEGISSIEIAVRQKKYGKNILVPKTVRNWLIRILLFLRLELLTIFILCVSFLFSYYVVAIVLFIILITAALLIIWKPLRKVEHDLPEHVYVIRDDTKHKVSLEQLVPGDILVLEKDYVIGADAVILSGENLVVNESLLDGESGNYHKQEGDDVYASTRVAQGSGLAVVTKIGKDTKIGSIFYGSDTAFHYDYYQRFMYKIQEFVLLGLFFMITFSFILQTTFYETIFGVLVLTFMTTPLFLPLFYVLFSRMYRFYLHGAKNFRLSEVDTIVCDKTGVLTADKPNVRELFVHGTHLKVTGEQWSTHGEILGTGYEELVRTSLLCNNATQQSLRAYTGDPTEIALLVLGQRADFDLAHMKEAYERVYELPFTPERKLMTVVCLAQHKLQSYTKGSADVVLHGCSHMMLSGKRVKLTDQTKRKLLKMSRDMSKKGMRVLAFGTKSLPQRNFDNVESSMVFLGFAGLVDPILSENTAALREAVAEGMHVSVFSGEPQESLHASLSEFADSVELVSDKTPEKKYQIVSGYDDEMRKVALVGNKIRDIGSMKRAYVRVGLEQSASFMDDIFDVKISSSFAHLWKTIQKTRRFRKNLHTFVDVSLYSVIPGFVFGFVIFLQQYFVGLIELLLFHLFLLLGTLGVTKKPKFSHIEIAFIHSIIMLGAMWLFKDTAEVVQVGLTVLFTLQVLLRLDKNWKYNCYLLALILGYFIILFV